MIQKRSPIRLMDQKKARTVVDPDSFQYILDENGNKVTQAAPIFGTEDFGGRGGIVNYVFEGMTAGSRGGGAVAIIAFTPGSGRCFWYRSQNRCC